MRRALLLASLVLAACGKAEPPTAAPAAPTAGYDASRDASADLQAALAAAHASGKRVLLEAGGNWNPRCTALNAFFGANPGLAALRDANFVTVKVSVESGGAWPPALKAYPAPAAYPHLFVIDENGSLIQSQNAAELEKGDTYDLEKLTYFLTEFAPYP